MFLLPLLALLLQFCNATTEGTCTSGVYDCQFEDEEIVIETCASYNGLYPNPTKLDGIMALAAIFGMLMAFGIGANDAANSWGTSVGSGAIGVTKAVLLCGFFEWLGATTLGYGVSKTIQKGVAKLTDQDCWACGYCHSRVSLAMGGSLGALVGASIFLLIASRTAVPVSTTHAIVGGVVGMTMAGAGSGCLNWEIDGGLTGIILSWIISPVLAGILAAGPYYLSKRFIIKSKTPRRTVKIALPFLFGTAMFCVAMILCLKAKAIKSLLVLWQQIIVSVFVGILTGAGAHFGFMSKFEKDYPSNVGTTELYLRGANLARMQYAMEIEGKENSPKSKQAAIRASVELQHPVSVTVEEYPQPQNIEEAVKVLEKKISAQNRRIEVLESTCSKKSGGATIVTSAAGGAMDEYHGGLIKNLDEEEDELADYMGIVDAETPEELDAIFAFKYLLVFTACLESLAHGSNDTANATGPFSAVYQFYTGGRTDCDSDAGTAWILCVAGLFVALGVATFGYRVIKTIGSKLTCIDFHKGFYVEWASATATMIATLLELPVSTTHCQVGAIIGVGLVTWQQRVGVVDWKLFSKIFLTWVLTLPIAGGISAIIALAVKGALTKVDKF